MSVSMSKTGLLAACTTLLAIFANSCGDDSRNRVSPDIAFDSSAAFRLLSELAQTGPRHSGSEGALKAVLFIEKELAAIGIPSHREEWTEDAPEGRTVFVNIIAEIEVSEKKTWIMLGSHYDTKKLDPCPGFQGANDGASGVAILIETARCLWRTREKLSKNVEIVFFDGEECAYSYSENDGLHGSRRHLEELRRKKRDVRAVVVADMLADKELDAFIPADSNAELASKFMKTVGKLGIERHFRVKDVKMLDDHAPFAEAGIPSILIIDFNYGPNNVYWHSSGDNLRNVSLESIAVSGSAICHFVLGLALE